MVLEHKRDISQESHWEATCLKGPYGFTNGNRPTTTIIRKKRDQNVTRERSMSGIPFFLCFTFVFYGFFWVFLICECTPRNDKKGLRNRLCHSNRDLENIFWICFCCFFFFFHVLFLFFFSLSFGDFHPTWDLSHCFWILFHFLSSFLFKKKKQSWSRCALATPWSEQKKEKETPPASTLSDKRYD